MSLSTDWYWVWLRIRVASRYNPWVPIYNCNQSERCWRHTWRHRTHRDALPLPDLELVGGHDLGRSLLSVLWRALFQSLRDLCWFRWNILVGLLGFSSKVDFVELVWSLFVDWWCNKNICVDHLIRPPLSPHATKGGPQGLRSQFSLGEFKHGRIKILFYWI